MAGYKGKVESKTRTGGGGVHKYGNIYRADEKKANMLKMLTETGNAKRNKDGKIVKEAAFQSKDAQPGRVQADRRWFGNTRVISQDALTHFRESLAAKQADPYSVVLKQNKLPMSLLQDSTKYSRPNLVTAEPFSDTFGKKAQRKKPKIDVGSFDELAAFAATAKASKPVGLASLTAEADEEEAPVASTSKLDFTDLGNDELNEQQRAELDDAEANDAPLDYILAAGTSKRIWGELYKVIDSSDIILHVLDARDPLGTRCHSVEKYLANEKKTKKVIYILNKVDLVPGWAAARWVQYLSKTHPTIAFHASINNSFGKGSLIQLLRQFSNLMSEKKQISVGFIGYPNVGKSSIINTIKSKKVCNVAPIPGETKVWQYIALMKRIYLIDCPGIVPPSSKDTETQKVLKGVVRVEHLSAPGDSIPMLLERVRPEYLTRTYGVEGWTDAEDFLTMIAKKRGKLGKGGEAQLNSVAIMILNDWIRGRIPYFVRPPESTRAPVKEAEPTEEAKEAVWNKADEKAFGTGRVPGVVQPLHQIVNRQRFIDVDSDKANAIPEDEVDEEEEWTGIAGEGDEAPEIVENDLENDGSDLEQDEEEDGDDDDEPVAWEDLVGGPATTSSSPAKKRQLEDDEVSTDGEGGNKKVKKQVKEPRMKTNKKKAENFFTHANVKNKNRERKIPKVEGRKKR
ncbi:NGP1NT-domain-containing protein [Cystobasidium minutum MCA 4210]|uniref:NGP1NT-domain-containing protein n=1 Tax=Cystobasidium minutum MCA 4210 TaxID=1397322 RepID=UPI0034CDB642|eukprot:jgi/Rhomi1/1074/CE1073_321